MVPCGKCDGCRMKAAREWTTRLVNESTCHDRNSFVTLTYEHAPTEIQKPHLQRFMKRLRQESKRPIRFFACGEYGKLTRRPHYHAIIFGEDFLGGAYPIDSELYGNKWLEKIWKGDKEHGGGQIAISEFTEATAAYVCGYVNKKINDSDTFNLMSTRPPIGYEYAVRHQKEIAQAEACVANGRKWPIPRAYRKWLKTNSVRSEAVDLDMVDYRKYLVQSDKTDYEIAKARSANHRSKLELRAELL